MKYQLWCKGENEYKANVCHNRQPTGCSQITFKLEGYQHNMIGRKLIDESENYWDLVSLAQVHERETNHETEII